jgi:hypothetical protein
MENLVTQIANADSFASGAWMLFWFSGLGMVVASWILIRKFKSFALKTVLMALVLFLCFSLAEIEFESGTVLWIPAIPFFGVDFAFEGRKYFDQLVPYLALSGLVSLLVSLILGSVGRVLFKGRTKESVQPTAPSPDASGE